MHFMEKPRCQLHCRLARPSISQWLRLLFASLRNRVHLRTRWKHWRKGKPAPAGRLGASSRFAPGSWVRVIDASRIFATLNRQKSLRGLLWVWQQWPYCGTVHQIFKPVRRMMDDSNQMRPISGTVLLASVPCSGPLGCHGCGRECPMMFRDEWLEEVPPPRDIPTEVCSDQRYARVRSVAEINATLDHENMRHGLLFMPEMYLYAGQRFPVRRQVKEVLDAGQYVPVAEPVHILDGLHCSGAIIELDGPCDRACRLLWHEDWIKLEESPARPNPQEKHS